MVSCWSPSVCLSVSFTASQFSSVSDECVVETVLISDWHTERALHVFTYKPGPDDPTWNWLTFKTGDVSPVLLFLLQRSFCSRLAPIDLHTAVTVISVGILYQFCNIVCMCVCDFRTSVRTSRTMWSRFTPCWRQSSPWNCCPTPSISSLTSGESSQDKTRHTVRCLFHYIPAHSSSVFCFFTISEAPRLL